MRRTLPVLAFLSSLVVLAPGRAMACSCAPFTDAEATRASEIVFAGTLADVGTPLLPTGDKTVTYLFEVDTVVKGRVHERVSMENFIDQGSSCSEELHRGTRYMVFGQDEEELRYGSCSATHVIRDGRVEGSSPLPGGPTLPPDVRRLFPIAAAVAALGGYLLWRRFRDPLRV
jgi:hypothetical protein